MSNPTDSVLIAIMGATGAGKSTFINVASGSQLQVGYGLESCTADVQVSNSLILNGRLVTLIDTPGFDDTVKSEAEILRLIADFLAATYEGGRKLNGVIFLHRISDYRMGGVARKNFRLFRKICGDDALKSVSIVTNMWGDVSEDVGARREKELSESALFFKPALEGGAQMFRHNNTSESARRVVQSLMGNAPEVLSIQREIVDQKKSIAETAAGIDLGAEIERQMEKHKEEMKELKKEMEELMASKDQKHQDEIEDLSSTLREVKDQLSHFELAHRRLTEDRVADKKESERKAMAMAREIEEREGILRTLREQAQEQASKIGQLQNALVGIEERAREQELKKEEVDEELKKQAESHQVELDVVRREFEAKLVEAAKRNEAKIAEKLQPPPQPKSPWDIVRNMTVQPKQRPQGFFRDIAFIVDQLFTPRPNRPLRPLGSGMDMV